MLHYPIESGYTGLISHGPYKSIRLVPDAPIAFCSHKRIPVFILHGMGGCPQDLSWLIKDLVHAGFFVVGIYDKHDNLSWRRPEVTSDIITKLQQSEWQNVVDFNQIGLVGYSVGGTTAVWLAGGIPSKLDSPSPSQEFSQSMDFFAKEYELADFDREMMGVSRRDPRVKGILMLAPAWSWIFDLESLSKITIPTYIIAGEGDEVIVSSTNAGLFARHIPNAFYQLIPGKAGHYVFFDAPDVPVPPHRQYMYQDDSSVDREWIKRQTGQEAVAFFRSLLQ